MVKVNRPISISRRMLPPIKHGKPLIKAEVAFSSFMCISPNVISPYFIPITLPSYTTKELGFRNSSIQEKISEKNNPITSQECAFQLLNLFHDR